LLQIFQFFVLACFTIYRAQISKSERDFHAGESEVKFVCASFQKQLVNLGTFLNTRKTDFAGILSVYKSAKNEETQ